MRQGILQAVSALQGSHVGADTSRVLRRSSQRQVLHQAIRMVTACAQDLKVSSVPTVPCLCSEQACCGHANMES